MRHAGGVHGLGAHGATARERRGAAGPRKRPPSLFELRRALAEAFGGGGTEPGCGAVARQTTEAVGEPTAT